VFLSSFRAEARGATGAAITAAPAFVNSEATKPIRARSRDLSSAEMVVCSWVAVGLAWSG
jgi:hypothetical protein